MATTWQPTTLVQCISVAPWLLIPGDDEPGGCHDLTLGKIYELVGVAPGSRASVATRVASSNASARDRVRVRPCRSGAEPPPR